MLYDGENNLIFGKRQFGIRVLYYCSTLMLQVWLLHIVIEGIIVNNVAESQSQW